MLINVSMPRLINDFVLKLKLACNLPAMMEGLSWNLLYSTENHGFSLNTLFRKLAHFDSAAFLIIQDVSDNVGFIF